MFYCVDAGKTSILKRFAYDDFSDTPPTLPDTVVSKDLSLADGTIQPLRIVDTGGQEKFRTLTSGYYGGCAGIIVVYDITDKSTFDALDNWFNESERYSTSPIILVGNKKDLQDKRVVTHEEAEHLGRPYYEASALTGEGVTEMFQAMVAKILENLSTDL